MSVTLQGANHEIKNMLAVIKANTYLLSKRLGKAADKKTLSMLRKVDVQINKITNILKKEGEG